MTDETLKRIGEKNADSFIEAIAPALRTEYHQKMHRKSYLAGWQDALEVGKLYFTVEGKRRVYKNVGDLFGAWEMDAEDELKKIILEEPW